VLDVCISSLRGLAVVVLEVCNAPYRGYRAAIRFPPGVLGDPLLLRWSEGVNGVLDLVVVKLRAPGARRRSKRKWQSRQVERSHTSRGWRHEDKCNRITSLRVRS